MDKLKAAFIGFMKMGEEDPYSVLESYAKIGYRGFEGGDMLLRGGDPRENLKRVKDFGMEPLSIGIFPFSNELPPVGELIEKCKTIDVKRVTSFGGVLGKFKFGPIDVRPEYDDIMKEIEEYEALASGLKKEGITFAFHNHDVEFTNTYNGSSAFNLMVANSENVKFEIDCAWVQFAGENPVLLLDRLGDRVCAIHIKDYTDGIVVGKIREKENIQPQFTTPGTGYLDLKGCLEAASRLKLEWAIVEQDFQRNLSPKETLTAAYLNMKETGLVE